MVEEQETEGAAAAEAVDEHQAAEGREAEDDQAVEGLQPSDQPDSTQYQ